MQEMESELARVIRLVDEAQEELHRPDAPLSAAVAKSARIARLRGDLVNLYWLEMEMHPIGEKSPRSEIEAALAQHYGDDWSKFRVRATAQYFKRRELEFKEGEQEELICALSVGQIEAQIKLFDDLAKSLKLEQGLAPIDAYAEARHLTKERVEVQKSARDLAFVQEKIRAHVGTFLSTTESQLLVGEAVSGIFEENRRYVDRELKAISDRALVQLSAAYRRRSEKDVEAGSQALTSCRRVLKSLADALYPPTDQVVEGADGVDRRMSDDKFVSRLLQFVSDRESGSGVSSLMVARLEDFSARVDAINALSSKGVHGQVTDFEVNQCVIQTYLLVGDFLHLRDATSNKVRAEERDPHLR